MKNNSIITTIFIYVPLFTMDILQNSSLSFQLTPKTNYQTNATEIADCSFFPYSDTFIAIQRDLYKSAICLYQKGTSTPKVTKELQTNLHAVSCTTDKIFAVLNKNIGIDKILLFKYEEEKKQFNLTLVIDSTFQSISTVRWHPEKPYMVCCDENYCHIIKYDDIKHHPITERLYTKQDAKKSLFYRNGADWSSDCSYLVTGPKNQFHNTNVNNIAFHFNEGAISHEVHNPTDITPKIIKINKKNDIAFTDKFSVGLYNNQTKKITMLEKYNCVNAIQFDTTGKYLAIANHKNLFIWNINKQKICAHHQCQFRIQTLDWPLNQREIIVGMNSIKANNNNLVGLKLKKLIPILTSSKDTEIENNK